MLKERLKEMDLRITELSDYLQVSRPTMYKMIERYDQGDRAALDKSVLRLFDYIMNHELVGKKNVVAYILAHFSDVKDIGDGAEKAILRRIRKCVLSDPAAPKVKFMEICSTSAAFDEVIDYLVRIYPLLKSRTRTGEARELPEPYERFLREIAKENQTSENENQTIEGENV